MTKGQVIAIDGKTVRGSHNQQNGSRGDPFEIVAIPELLRLLDVSGCIVTIDAPGCQTKIAQTIRDEKADYILQVKDNQSHLKQDIQDWFAIIRIQRERRDGDQISHETCLLHQQFVSQCCLDG